MIRPLLVAALALLPATAALSGEDDHLSELDGLRAVHAWTRATESGTALVFLELENEGDAEITLDGAATKIAPTVELVGFRLVDGAETWEVLPPVPLGPGRELELAPDALALRLTGLDRALAQGDEFEMDLATSLGAMTVHVEVEATDATQHSHAGHDH